MKHHLPQANVTANVKTGPGTYLLTLEAPAIAECAQPGQFVHLRCSDGNDPALRRPFSVCRVNKEKGLISLWYQVAGRGTDLLSKVQPGAGLDIIGPLGRGFETGITGKKAGLVGGGIGIAPLVFLGDRLAAANTVTGFFGSKTKELLPPREILPPVELILATEDGSAGYKGLVTDLLSEWIEKEKPGVLYACGPKGMLREVVNLAGLANIPLQVSLEANMACGVGACLGCACAKSSSDETIWLKTCLDGPVFWVKEVRWQDEPAG